MAAFHPALERPLQVPMATNSSRRASVAVVGALAPTVTPWAATTNYRATGSGAIVGGVSVTRETGEPANGTDYRALWHVP